MAMRKAALKNSKPLIEKLKQQPDRTSEDGWHHYNCKLVTPMYGGGVEAGKVDMSMPIRAASIRGQLRFWWRVACGRLDPPQDMFKREVAIWGGLGGDKPTASKVTVLINEMAKPEVEPAFIYERKPDNVYKAMPKAATWAEAYALFSARGKLDGSKRVIETQPAELALANLGFTLRVKCSESLSDAQKGEVEKTLRWFASFGGVGARTRRGVGAVWFNDPLLKPVLKEEVEAAGGALLTLKALTNAQDAWHQAVAKLKEFRQGPGLGRNGSTSSPGRSLWPEADAIRKLSGRFCNRHDSVLIPGEVFPRAAFGLPLVFHFMDEHHGCPADHILEPANISANKKRDRMASPLILRPYWDGTHWRPAALLLPVWQSALKQSLKFKDQTYVNAPESWPKDDPDRRTKAADIKPMQTATGKLRVDDPVSGPDPLSAFMQFFSGGP